MPAHADVRTQHPHRVRLQCRRVHHRAGVPYQPPDRRNPRVDRCCRRAPGVLAADPIRQGNPCAERQPRHGTHRRHRHRACFADRVRIGFGDRRGRIGVHDAQRRRNANDGILSCVRCVRCGSRWWPWLHSRFDCRRLSGGPGGEPWPLENPDRVAELHRLRYYCSWCCWYGRKACSPARGASAPRWNSSCISR